MIDIKQAVSVAYNFIEETYPHPLDNLDLEEIRRSEDDKHWLITIGFSRAVIKDPEKHMFALPAFPRRENERVYKVIEIDAETGRPLSMQIRTL